MKKNSVFLTLVFLILFSCKENHFKEDNFVEIKAADIPLDSVMKHIEYQQRNGLKKTRVEYENLFNQNQKSENAYYLYVRSISDEYIKYDSLKKGLELYPKNNYLLSELGGLLINWNEKNKSSDYLKESYQYDNLNPLTNYHLFRLYDIKNEYNNQLFHLQQLSKSKYHYLFINSKNLEQLRNTINENIGVSRERNKQNIIESKRRTACMEYSSREMVDERLNRLNYNTLGYPRLIAQNNCRFSWFVNVVNRNGFHSECVIITDGSTGKVEIIKVDCT